ncbi:MAG: hypothetical protein FWE45_03200 [Firmicutes bacterium]|nr:hypothetical protein [Bacillota bacterium]
MKVMHKNILPIISLVLNFATVALTCVWFFKDGNFTGSLSSLGRSNASLFITWTILVSVTLIFTMALIANRLGIKFKEHGFWSSVFYLFLITAGLSNIISNSFLGRDPTSMAVHLWFSLTFGTFSLFILALLMFLLIIKTKKSLHIIMFCVHAILSIVFLVTILAFDFLAFFQILMVIIVFEFLSYLVFETCFRKNCTKETPSCFDCF